MSSFPIDPASAPGYGAAHPNPQLLAPPHPPGQPLPQYFPPAQYAGGQYQQNTNFNQPFPQYGPPVAGGQPPPNQQPAMYYTQQQQQPVQQQQRESRAQGCCDTISNMMAGACAGMMCYMCLFGEGGCCEDGAGGLMDGEGNPGQNLMGFDDD